MPLNENTADTSGNHSTILYTIVSGSFPLDDSLFLYFNVINTSHGVVICLLIFLCVNAVDIDDHGTQVFDENNILYCTKKMLMLDQSKQFMDEHVELSRKLKHVHINVMKCFLRF